MSIATKIESISNHLTDAYNSLENLGANLENTNKNINNISTILEQIYEDYPKNNINNITQSHLDTKKGKMTVSLKGNTSQKTTTGKNLFDSGQIKNISDYIIANGTGIKIVKTTNGRMSPLYNISLEANTEYALSCNLISTTTNPTMYCQWKANDGSTLWSPNLSNGSTTFTPSKDIVGVVFYLQNTDTDGTYVELKNLQIEKGSTATSYEPYTNGLSPNPNYPQKIDTISGNNKIIIAGANLFNPEWWQLRTTNGITATLENNILTLNGTSTGNAYINFEFPQGSFLNENNSWYVKADADLSNLHINNTGSAGSGSLNITPTTTFTKTNYINTSYSTGGYLYIAKGITLNNCKLYIDIRNDGPNIESFVYEPYQNQTYSINFPVKNIFNKNGNVKSTYGAVKTILDTGIRATTTQSGKSLYYAIELGSDELLGQTLTISANVQPSGNNTGQTYIFFGNANSATTTIVNNSNLSGTGRVKKTVTIPDTFPNNTDRLYILIYANGASVTAEEGDYVDYIDFQIEIGDNANRYTDYGIEPIELYKINNAQDIIFKNEINSIYYNNELNLNSWYWKRKNYKTILNGTENYLTWGLFNTNYFSSYINKLTSNPGNPNGDIISDHLPFSNYTTVANATGVGCFTGGDYIGISVPKNILSDVSTQANAITSLKNWILNNNMEFIYTLKNEINIEITDTALINQLNALKNAKSYSEQTNIIQLNNDLPFILDVKTLEKNSN